MVACSQSIGKVALTQNAGVKLMGGWGGGNVLLPPGYTSLFHAASGIVIFLPCFYLLY